MRCPIWIRKWLTKSRRISRIPWLLRLLFPTLHFCCEWDGLCIDRYCQEYDCCTCLENREGD